MVEETVEGAKIETPEQWATDVRIMLGQLVRMAPPRKT